MSCRFSDHNGYCQLFDGSIEMPGCDKDGICLCEDDEDPTKTCEDYEER